MWVVGKIQELPPKWNGTLRGPFPFSDESDDFYKQFPGKPVYIEHNPREVIGHVMEVWKSDMYMCMLASLHLYNVNFATQFLNLQSNGLSVGHKAVYENGVRKGKMTVVEVSICKEGAVPHTRILAYGIHNIIIYSQSGIKRVMSSLSEQEVAKKSVEAVDPNEELEQLRRFKSQQEMKEKNTLLHNIDLFLQQATPFIQSTMSKGEIEALKKNFTTSVVTDPASLGSIVAVCASSTASYQETLKQYEKKVAELEAELRNVRKRVMPDEVSFVTASERTNTDLPSQVANKFMRFLDDSARAGTSDQFSI